MFYFSFLKIYDKYFLSIAFGRRLTGLEHLNVVVEHPWQRILPLVLVVKIHLVYHLIKNRRIDHGLGEAY